MVPYLAIFLHQTFAEETELLQESCTYNFVVPKATGGPCPQARCQTTTDEMASPEVDELRRQVEELSSQQDVLYGRLAAVEAGLEGGPTGGQSGMTPHDCEETVSAVIGESMDAYINY